MFDDMRILELHEAGLGERMNRLTGRIRNQMYVHLSHGRPPLSLWTNVGITYAETAKSIPSPFTLSLMPVFTQADHPVNEFIHIGYNVARLGFSRRFPPARDTLIEPESGLFAGFKPNLFTAVKTETVSRGKPGDSK